MMARNSYKISIVTQLANATGISRTIIYRLAKQLGRYPTLQELQKREITKKVGRPRKEK